MKLGLDMPPPAKTIAIVPSENWVLEELQGIPFQKFEMDFIKKFKDHLRCPTCKNYAMANKGAAGVPGAAGCRKQSLICSKQFNGCGKTTRLDNILEDMNAEAALALYKERYATAVEQYQRKTSGQTKITDAFPKKRKASPTPLEVVEQGDDTPEVVHEIPITEPVTDYQKLYEELKLQFEQQAGLISTLTATIETLNTKLDQLTQAPTPAEASATATKTRPAARKQEKEIVEIDYIDKEQSAASTSYANVAKAGPKMNMPTSKKGWKKVTASMIRPVQEPLEFSKLHLTITDSRPLKRCKNAREVNALLRKLLIHIGIANQVLLFSKIGNSILEIYVPTKDLRDIVGKIEAKEIQLNPGYNPTEVPAHVVEDEAIERMEAKAIKRVAFLYCRAWLKKLKECIFDGFDESFRTKVLQEIANSRQQQNQVPKTNMNDAAALIKPARPMENATSGW